MTILDYCFCKAPLTEAQIAINQQLESCLCDQVRCQLTCSATETSYNIENLRGACLISILSMYRKIKALIRLCGWLGGLRLCCSQAGERDFLAPRHN